MSYEVFCKKVYELLRALNMKARFIKTDDGRYIAKVSDGSTIIGNSVSLKVTLRWASGHQAMAEI